MVQQLDDSESASGYNAAYESEQLDSSDNGVADTVIGEAWPQFGPCILWIKLQGNLDGMGEQRE
ncbi:hypothetical protein OC861_006316 [Tilletia horrida]|nr:hypothetical protein OC861_006316 [Tilletia horrida]